MKLVVLGMHRSGNSVLAGLLNLMGANSSSVEVSRHANEWARESFPQHSDVGSLNEALLKSIDCAWDCVNTFSVGRLPAKSIEQFNVEAKKLVADLNVHRSWVISDPSLCLLFPFWKPIIADSVCIHIYRNPIEIARSLEAVTGTPISVGIALWERYTIAALSASRDQVNLFASYKSLMTQPGALAQDLIVQLSDLGMAGLSVPPSLEVERFIDVSLYRERDGDDSCSHFLNSRQARLYQSLVEGSVTQETRCQEMSRGGRQILHDFERASYQAYSNPTADLDSLESEQEVVERLERQELDALKWRAAVWQREAHSLDRIMQRLVRGVSAMAGSNTWKIGSKIVSAKQKLLGRSSEPSALNYVNDAIYDYDLWKKKTVVEEDVYSIGNHGESAFSFQKVLPCTPTVDILVCVHNALGDVMRCLSSIVENTPRDYTLYIVNDGSEDKTTKFLREFKSGHPGTILLENKKAGGYTKAANRALRLSTAEYVVCLNSDTIVPRLWLNSLVECGESDPSLGIVGPLSNAASWQSVPERFDAGGDWIVNELRNGFDVNQMAELVYQVSERRFPRVDFVNGFCFAIKRAVIDAIGYLDEEAFPAGYGEENDYCLRASQAGFRLAIADQAYVYHAKSKSYSHEKRRVLSKKGGAALKNKHGVGAIERGVDRLKYSPDLKQARSVIRQYLQDGVLEQRNRPGSFAILYVVCAGVGNDVQSIAHEADAMRSIGITAKVAMLKGDREELLVACPSLDTARHHFLFFADEGDLSRASERFNVVVATCSLSAALIEPIVEENQKLLAVYCIPGSEPCFFEQGGEGWRASSEVVVNNFVDSNSTNEAEDVQGKEICNRGLVTAKNCAIKRAVLSRLSLFRLVMAEQDIKLQKEREIIQISEERPLRIVLWPCVMRMSNEPTGSAYIRLIEPLGSKAIAAKVQVSIIHSLEQLKHQSVDICIVQRNAIGNESIAAGLFEYCQGKEIRVLHEIDDDLFNLEGNEGALLDNEELLALKVVAARSHAVITSTPALQQLFHALNANVFCIQNVLSEELWCRTRVRPEAAGSRPVRVLYMGTRTHGDDLNVITDAWRRIEGKYAGRVTLDVIGGAAKDDLQFGNSIAIPPALGYPDFVQWLKTQGPWDIGLIPLRDTAFNRKKSHIKFLDYSALSLAIVCSDREAYRDIAMNEENSLLVNDSSDEWYEAIERLIEDEVLRLKLGNEAYSCLRENYCLEDRASDWLNTFQNVLNGSLLN